MTAAILPSVSPDQYHADQLGDVPTLSASIACILATKTPAHAREAHPRLNAFYKQPDAKTEWDVGTAAHSLLLEGYDKAHVVEGYDNWKTNAAKDERDEARANGMIPMLRHEWEAVSAMVDAARVWIAASDEPSLLEGGTPEVTLRAELDGVLCRSRIDYLRDDHAVIADYKTSMSADQTWFSERGIYANGYDLKAAFYLRMVKAATGVDAVFRWIVQEKKPPFCLSIVTPGPDVLAVADDKVKYALNVWRECLASGEWPGYDRRVATAELPAWEEVKWMERSAA